jgi:hypothetical protein
MMSVSCLLLKADVNVTDIVKSIYRGKCTHLIFLRDQEVWRMFSCSAQKAKIRAQAMRKQSRLRIHLLGEEGRKRQIHLHTMAASTKKGHSTGALCSKVWLIVKGKAWELHTNLKARTFPISISLWAMYLCLTCLIKFLLMGH